MSNNVYPWTNFHAMNLDWVVQTTEEARQTAQEAAGAVSEIKEDVEGEMSSLDARVETAEDSLSTLDSAVQSAQSDITAAQGDIEDLQQAISGLYTQADYVIEEDSDSNGWSWTKWNSGKIEARLFTSFNGEPSANFATYLQKSTKTVSVPFDFAPLRTIAVGQVSGIAGGSAWLSDIDIDGPSVSMSIISNNNQQAARITIQLYICGFEY